MFRPNDSPHEDPPVPGGYTGINPYADHTGFVPICYMGKTPVYSSDPNYVPPLMDPGHIAALMEAVDVTSSYVAPSSQRIWPDSYTLSDGKKLIPVAEYDSLVTRFNTLQKKFETEHETCDKLKGQLSMRESTVNILRESLAAAEAKAAQLSNMLKDANKTLATISRAVEARNAF